MNDGHCSWNSQHYNKSILLIWEHQVYKWDSYPLVVYEKWNPAELKRFNSLKINILIYILCEFILIHIYLLNSHYLCYLKLSKIFPEKISHKNDFLKRLPILKYPEKTSHLKITWKDFPYNKTYSKKSSMSIDLARFLSKSSLSSNSTTSFFTSKSSGIA